MRLRIGSGALGTLRSALRALLLQFMIVLAVFAALELVLRAIDLRYLRQTAHVGQDVVYRYDGDLGWSPVPGSESKFFGSRTISVRHNSLGLRDIEYSAAAKPVMLFLGDSLVWGYDVEVADRFTDILRKRQSHLVASFTDHLQRAAVPVDVGKAQMRYVSGPQS